MSDHRDPQSTDFRHLSRYRADCLCPSCRDYRAEHLAARCIVCRADDPTRQDPCGNDICRACHDAGIHGYPPEPSA